MLHSLLSLIAIAYLPGAVLFRVPFADRDRRAALDAEERVFWAVALSVAWSSLVVLGLAALRRFTFDRLLVIDLGLALALAVSFRHHLRYGAASPRVTRTALLPLAVLVLGGWLFFPPFEHVIGGKDPGTYVNEGIQIAQHGSLVMHDEVVSSLPRQVRDLFFPRDEGKPYYAPRFMGFFIQDPDRGTVVGQFPQLFPAWIAVGYHLDGVQGALAVTPLAALLGLLAVYFAGARLLGRSAAFIGAALLALNVATVWFAREPNSEVAAQILIFAGALAYARAQVDGDRFFAPVAAVFFGLLPFARIDGAVALAALAGGVVLQTHDRRWPRPAFLVPLTVLGVAAAVYWTSVMSAYGQRIRVLLFDPHMHGATLLHLAAAGLVFLVFLVGSRFDRLRAAVRNLAPGAIVVAVIGAAVYAYFFRMPGKGLADYDARSLEAFTWYFPPIGLAAAVIGFGVVTWRSFWRAPVLLLTVAAYAFFFFYKIQIKPEHFWAARRYVSAILPGAALMAGAAITGLVTVWPPARRRWRLAAAPLAAALVLLIAVPSVRALAPVLRHVEYAGMLDRMEDLARRFGERDLVVFESRDTGSDVFVLGIPLDYIWHRTVLTLPNPKPDKAQFKAFLDWARHRYANVYFVGGGGTDLVSRDIGVTPVFSDRFQVPEYQSAWNAFPHEIRRKEFDFGVYRFTAPTAAPPVFTLDIGRMDDLSVYRFHSKETGADGLYRWSQHRSYIAVLRSDAARTLTLWMNNGGRPDKGGPARVAVYIIGDADRADVLLGSVVVTSGVNAYSFPIAAGAVVPAGSPGADDAMIVKLESTTWNPRLVLGTPDDRDLGVMVSRIEVK